MINFFLHREAYVWMLTVDIIEKFQLKLKEAMHINWEKPNLNQQVHHINLTHTLKALFFQTLSNTL